MSENEIILELYQAKLADSGSEALENDYLKFIKQITEGLAYKVVDFTGIQGSYNVFSRLTRLLRQYPSVYSLKFFSNLNKDIGLQRIVQVCRTNPRITSLDIGCNDLSDESCGIMIDMVKYSNLNSLQLGKFNQTLLANRFTRDGITNFIIDISKQNKLRKLGLSGIGSLKQRKTLKYNDFSQVIGNMIALCTKLLTLDISEMGFVDSDIPHISQGFSFNKTLKHLALSNNIFTDAAPIINSIMMNKNLRYLQVNNCGITAASIEHLANALSSGHQLIYLDISNNHVGSNGISVLFRVLAENIYLTELFMSNVEANSDISTSFNLFLSKNEVIHELDISKNNLGDNFANVLAMSITEQKSLVKLNLSSCRISDEGVLAVGKALQANKTLKKLILRDNFLSKNCGYDLLDVIKSNKSITSLDMTSNHIDIFTNNAIKTFCERNKNNQIDDTLAVMRKKYINLSIDSAKIPGKQSELDSLIEEKKKLNAEIDEIQNNIDREKNLIDINLKEDNKSLEEMKQFIKDDHKVINDTTLKMKELLDNKQVDIKTFQDKCKFYEEEFERLEKVAQNFVVQTDEIRKKGEADKADYADKIAQLTEMIKDIKAHIKDKATILEYEIPENPFIEKKQEENQNDPINFSMMNNKVEEDPLLKLEAELTRRSELENAEKNKKKKKVKKAKKTK